MTTQKRIRIFEIIVGIILIALSIQSIKTFIWIYFGYADHITWERIKDFFSSGKYSLMKTFELIAMLFQIVIGLMLITRKYSKSWLRIPFVITAAARILSSYIVWLIIGQITGDIKFSDYSQYIADKRFICLIIAPLIEIIGIVMAFLTIKKKIVWKSRKKLLLYTLAGITASIIISAITYNASVSMLIFLIPCFVQPYASKRSIKGIIGEIAVIFSTLSYYIIRWLINTIYDPENEAFYNFFFGTNPAIDLRHFSVQSLLQWTARIIALLMPLLLFERQVGEFKEEPSESVSVIKKLDAVLFRNDDEEAEEYSDAEENDDDND
jgi:hypothetical protein